MCWQRTSQLRRPPPATSHRIRMTPHSPFIQSVSLFLYLYLCIFISWMLSVCPFLSEQVSHSLTVWFSVSKSHSLLYLSLNIALPICRKLSLLCLSHSLLYLSVGNSLLSHSRISKSLFISLNDSLTISITLSLCLTPCNSLSLSLTLSLIFPTLCHSHSSSATMNAPSWSEESRAAVWSGSPSFRIALPPSASAASAPPPTNARHALRHSIIN